ncbi:hypothetical protein BWK60_03690 [Flavobacterium covae]|uniref:hypothetical protein n=1 Tax=Flavobacterium covae TaxID=2906076 RepID=UPI000B4DC337|nr:hypothetical protein [Flavobacterium covae]OWP87443.1 hypothetical protein BWK60_03690 [Flavobacterium covae]
MKNLKKFPNQYIIFKINIPILKENIRKAIHFKKPNGMDDRWFVTYENNTIKFYRTWTGNCIYIAKLNENKDCIIEIFINNEPDEYKYSNDKEELLLFEKIFNLLLGEGGNG